MKAPAETQLIKAAVQDGQYRDDGASLVLTPMFERGHRHFAAAVLGSAPVREDRARPAVFPRHP
ncbi:MAG: hypothetical protein ACR2ME_07135 [Acidimicrobiia bacterium]